ncbi:hypothetical protein, variant 9 [Aphanomyces invadans]|uniref:F-box domain-containing protein n=1 Tax=Aphanomyces invadans TaxID=157072 RepID=A0A024UEE1_9STRA|nr:hypothetical protein, variant 8 [Aphanomyces invadans]XP_008866007.1 hypothetical protein, variant 9 [Aphanomyces invadans]ETW04575.1 hypothetical protein, variant 8 [Aphanomyces invadans]ETW04576.1 hypothetical protein, variant 9 [Aphanomyces invadans]|eukprot:XP_008866006.1 hypothetical protein, variant 8 [Aphanomyces invadans]
MTSTMLEAFFHGYTQRATEDVLTVVAVKSVLDDMIADIETWIHETERNALTTELEKANAALAQYAIAERIHWDEKQNVLQTVHLLQLQGRTLVRKLKTEAELVAQDVLNKARLEKELAESKEKIASYATLSRELSRSQREVRELHRRLGIQNVLNPSAIQEKAGPPPNHDPTSTPTGLASLSDATLLNIFSNVDAMDVLAMSLTSKAWKSRIHVMFGLKKEKLQRRTALPPTIPKPLNVKPSLRPVPALDKSQLARADDMIKSFNAKEMKFFHDLMIRMKTLEVAAAAANLSDDPAWMGIVEALDGTSSRKGRPGSTVARGGKRSRFLDGEAHRRRGCVGARHRRQGPTASVPPHGTT